MTQIDLCALKQKMAYELSNLIPQSYSEATLFNALDYLSGKGYLAQATKADDLKHAPTIEKLKERLER